MNIKIFFGFCTYALLNVSHGNEFMSGVKDWFSNFFTIKVSDGYCESQDELLVKSEAVKKMKIYSGINNDDASLGIDWKLKILESNIAVFSSKIFNNPLLAIRASTVMKVEKSSLLDLLINRNRVGEYDDLYDSSEVDYNILLF